MTEASNYKNEPTKQYMTKTIFWNWAFVWT